MTREDIIKAKGTKVHKITNSLGVYDCYVYLRKRKWIDTKQCLTSYLFYKIIRDINTYIAEQISLGNDFRMPHKMGILELRKIHSYVNFKDKEMHTNLPIDWNSTIKLWCEDLDSYKKRKLVRINTKFYFKINYNRNLASYKNKSFYHFRPCRSLKLKLKDNVNNNLIDAFDL